MIPWWRDSFCTMYKHIWKSFFSPRQYVAIIWLVQWVSDTSGRASTSTCTAEKMRNTTVVYCIFFILYLSCTVDFMNFFPYCFPEISSRTPGSFASCCRKLCKLYRTVYHTSQLFLSRCRYLIVRKGEWGGIIFRCTSSHHVRHEPLNRLMSEVELVSVVHL